ncbi:MAG: helix-turn-helix domain-containing protein [Bacteroidales bacterium]
MGFSDNAPLHLAYDFVEKTGKNIFLTGRAGTGKTTFLHQIKNSSVKRSVVVAPTGVAAINAGGVTIHSFFQMPFGPIIPGMDDAQERSADARFKKFSKEKINIIRSLDLLIIDEISMVRADLLDGIDGVLRKYRHRDKPFGGLQLLLIGDLQQLAPVVKDDEKNLLSPYYETFFFFGSRALRETNYISIELSKVYRQTDEKFIRLLNKVRDNDLDLVTLEKINQQYDPEVFHGDTTGYITLTTHNFQANQLNTKKLSEIRNTPHTFHAVIEGDFPEHSFPTDQKLTLKEGAQVMFVKNDPSPDKLFYNGKIGTIAGFENDNILVTCENEDEPIVVSPLIWENKRYSLDQQTKEISEKFIGSFTQYPLKLAWAITIHKSQGLTFEKAIIDAQSAFAHGQVYVALSRCKSLEGLVLSSRIGVSSIKNDHNIKGFIRQVEENQPGEEQLREARLQFQLMLLEELFDFNNVQRRLNYLLKLAHQHSRSLDNKVTEVLRKVKLTLDEKLAIVGVKFGREINKHVYEYREIENNSLVQDRIKKASGYFSPILSDQVKTVLEGLDMESDNKKVQKSLDDGLSNLMHELKIKTDCLQSLKKGFTTTTFLEVKAKASIEDFSRKSSRSSKKRTVLETSKDVEHPDLLSNLRSWRDNVAKQTGSPHYMVLPRKPMHDISNLLPANLKVLGSIPGIGKKKIEQFGHDIISLVVDYCVNNDVKPNYSIPDDMLVTKNKSSDPNNADGKPTAQITLELFRTGMNIQQIAEKRELAVSTIEGHVSQLVKVGDIQLHEVVNKEKSEKMLRYFSSASESGLTAAREKLGEAYSYFELRCALSFFQKNEKI